MAAFATIGLALTARQGAWPVYFGLTFGGLGVAFVVVGAADYLPSARAVIAARIVALLIFGLTIVAMVAWLMDGDGSGVAPLVRRLQTATFVQHPWFWPGLALLIGVELLSFLIFRKVAPPETRRYSWMYLVALPVIVITYIIGFAAGTGG